MKFSCTQENLNRALQVVGHIANKNVNLPILQNILLGAEDNKIILSSTNLEIGIRVTIRGKVEETGEFTLPAQLFANYVNLLSTDKVDCVLEGKEFSITASDQKTIIKGDNSTDFPLLPSVEKERAYTISKKDFEVGLQQTVVAASVDETRPEIAGVLFNFSTTELILAATDSYRLAERKINLTPASHTEPIKVILPQRAAQELLRITQASTTEHISLYVTDSQLACDIDDTEFVSRVIEGNFPDYEQIIPTHGITTAIIKTDEFIKAVKGAALFSKTGINDIKLTFTPDSNTLYINAVNAQLGENTTTLACNLSGSENSIVFNYRYLLDGLQQLRYPEAELMIVDPMSPGVLRPVETGQYLYIIMPIKQ